MGAKFSTPATGRVDLLGMHLPGQSKWLGGELGADGCVYGIPGDAREVLFIDPETEEISTFGGPLPGKNKWLRGILAADNCIYGLPCCSPHVLKITPATKEAVTIGGPFDGAWQWHGGVLAPNNGCIYGIPCSAEAVVKIDPGRGGGEVTTFGGPWPGKQKWYGGLLGGDGCIYGIPQNAGSVIKIDPRTDEVTFLGDFPEGGWKWHGGVVDADGNVYGLPNNIGTVLKIDVYAGEVSTFGGPFDDPVEFGRDLTYRYLGGVVGADGNIYCIPGDANRVLKIMPATMECKVIGRYFNGVKNKWQNGFQGRDGVVYGIAQNWPGMLAIDIETEETWSVGENDGKDKWEGGVVDRKGQLWCMPLRAKQVGVIRPGRERRLKAKPSD